MKKVKSEDCKSICMITGPTLLYITYKLHGRPCTDESKTSGSNVQRTVHVVSTVI